MTSSYPEDLAKVETRVVRITPVVEMYYDDGKKITVFLDTGASGSLTYDETFKEIFGNNFGKV